MKVIKLQPAVGRPVKEAVLLKFLEKFHRLEGSRLAFIHNNCQLAQMSCAPVA